VTKALRKQSDLQESAIAIGLDSTEKERLLLCFLFVEVCMGLLVEASRLLAPGLSDNTMLWVSAVLGQTPVPIAFLSAGGLHLSASNERKDWEMRLNLQATFPSAQPLKGQLQRRGVREVFVPDPA
jgi:hypothetical protein